MPCQMRGAVGYAIWAKLASLCHATKLNPCLIAAQQLAKMRRKVSLLIAALAAPLFGQTYFPAPPSPLDNPPSAAKELLGMALFWEEQLSHADTVSCGTCHSFRTGGGDGRLAVHPGIDGLLGTADDIRGSRGVLRRNGPSAFAVDAAMGVAQQVTRRKAPSVINAGYSTMLFYDGRARSLEELALVPLLNHVEMGFIGRTEADLVQKVQQSRPLALAANVPQRLQTFIQGQSYATLFAQAFGSGGITGTRIANALASYVRTLNSDQSKYDHYLAGQVALSAEEARGLFLFERSGANSTSAAACSQCHGDISPTSHSAGPTFENLTPYGTPQQHNNFHNTGVRPIAEDAGRSQGTFKVPLLRNVALRAPFMHNGSLLDLVAVLDFYSRGGDFHQNQAPEVQPIQLTVSERTALLSFLNTLTDPRVQNELPPFDRPLLQSERNVSATIYGTSMTSGALVSVRLMAEGPAFLGKPAFVIGVAGIEPFQPAFLLLDVAGNPAGSTINGLNCWLGLTPALAPIFAGLSLTTANLVLSIPNQPLLVGSTLYAQWVVADSRASTGLVTSDALALVILP